MQDLPSKPTLADYQKHVRVTMVERGFDKETLPEVFTVLVEEFGELAKAVRKSNQQKIDKKSKQYDVAEEAADVFWLLLDLCNRLNIDLEKAYQLKEKKNQKRQWS